MFNPYLAEQLAHQRTEEAAREAERSRLIGFASSPDEIRESRRPLALIWNSLSAFFFRPEG
jgi:hypothetical protein